ncbi:sensor histidine kinase [Sulfurivermis fontis]|uniref:sensor histidine kinase n=1 Tax=Sulfurivermis fontis TaxID=1972068 RepID=UPI000FD9F09D|nr:sensor histidine kinase [Sulfurivermis fontis]
MASLQGRLSIGLLITLLAVFLLQGAVSSLALRDMTQDYIASRLLHDSESLLAAIQPQPDGTLGIDTTRIDGIYQRPYSGHYYRIESGQQVLRSRSLWDQDLPVPVLASGAEQRLQRHGPQHQPLLVVVHGYSKDGRDITIAVAEDLGLIRASVHHFQWLFVLVSLGALVSLFLLQRWLVRRSLRPLVQVRADIDRLERGDIASLPEQVPAELQPLIREVNRLLVAFAERLQRSRNALGNLAHALKTPLSLLGQVSEDPTLTANPALHERLTTPLTTMRQLIDRELKRARLAGGNVPGRRFVPEQELPPLLDVLRRLHTEKDLAFDCRLAAGLAVNADREDMLELLGNLLDNACKWSRGKIRITTAERDGFCLCVEDDGPGCSDAQLASLTARGVRIDESTAGHGLGLAIASDIVTGYGGTLRFGRSESLGGFRVEVTLPPL